ncbi:MAG: hypothetical protein K6U88_00600 [Dehalococcoidia bacterium]|jgi:hypothetical protein|uniref:DUF4190 domain-containing protein n=1 Tax=Tepidiforma bonchosmolovskayae TaxID=2601677 RepID=A0ABX6C3Z8_9CHLR|nr:MULTISPECIES: hypothetical protein [Tepidiforma]MCL6643475.1 hypothetical protein [Dehalococcoidia bacterium]QFG03992.1 hypothetical protein Tbon_12095 [Tepidiforma bonchosmolovskayae]GIW15262.1 MAG: hypothetical protein KatS3mg063_1115 [Tepidiforma sp.]
MAASLPFLISAMSLGVINLLIFLASALIITIPVFATRGRTQAIWAAVSGTILLVEAVILVTLVVLTGQGKIFS